MEDWLEPLHDAETMRSVDSWAISERGVPSLELMEAAGGAVAEVVESVARPGPVRIVCGKGNNGGDGLVAARHLARAGHKVEALLLWGRDELSEDALANLERFDGPTRVVDTDLEDALQDSGAIIDAIFGTGFSGAPHGTPETAIRVINGAAAPVVAADVASGVDASTGEVAGVAVEADVTVSFHAPKLGHRIAPGKDHTGELRVAPIGIPAGGPDEAPAGLIAEAVLGLPPRREPSSTKFTSGQVLVVGGSRGLTGAVCLAAEGAIRAGAGYATVAVPADLESIFELKLTEVMSRGVPASDGRLSGDAADAILEVAERAGAVVLGPGLGRADDSLALARRLARELSAPLVVDADGLNAHAGALDELAKRDGPAMLTPHAGELGRLLDRPSDEVAAHRLASARDASERARAIVLLKGDDTIVADGRAGELAGQLAVNERSSPGLATAGTGDVLAGVIAAFLARGLEPFAAACAAVYAHSVAGVIAAERLGAAESVVARDVIAALPQALAGGE